MSSAARVALARSAAVVRHSSTAKAAAPRVSALPFPSVFLESLASPPPFKPSAAAKGSRSSATYSVYLDAHFQNAVRHN